MTGGRLVLVLDDFSQAISGIYDASMEVERWRDVLALIARMFGGRGAQINVGTPENFVFLKTWGWTDEELERFLPAYIAMSPVDPRGGMIASQFKAVHCRQFVTDEALHTSEFYRKVLEPVDVEYSMAFTIPVDPKMLCLLGVMRGRDSVPFTTSDCEEFGRFVPHIGRAVTMHGAFQHYRNELDAVRMLLDDVPLGMMVIDNEELKVANCAARTLLDEGDVMCVRNGRLQGATRRSDAELRDAVDEALCGHGRAIGVTLPIDHEEPVRAVVRRLHPASAGMLGTQSGSVALYVTDPRKPVETPEEILQWLFGLSAREATVLRLLVDGKDLRTVAKRLRIHIETVRSHVKHIMETTGTSRQAELIRMVLSSPAWIAGTAKARLVSKK